MMQQKNGRPRARRGAGQGGQVQRFFGNAPLAPPGPALVEQEQEKAPAIGKQEN